MNINDVYSGYLSIVGVNLKKEKTNRTSDGESSHHFFLCLMRKQM